MLVNNSSGVDLNGRILHLTLKKRWFDLMVAGKKRLNTDNLQDGLSPDLRRNMML